MTGASAGVGRATAVAFARRGMSVALLARGHEGLRAAAADVDAAGGRALVVPADVADADAVEAAAELVERELGPIDVWVNNAMTTVFAPVWDVSAEEFRRATEVTYLGQVHGTMSALRRMRPRDRGTICNVGSALSFRAIPLQSAYCGAKFATRGFTEAVRAELLHERSGVAVTMVHLPAVNTPQFGWCLNRMPRRPQPVAPVYSPDTAAAHVVAAALDPHRQKILGGFNKTLVLINKVGPRGRRPLRGPHCGRLPADGRARRPGPPLRALGPRRRRRGRHRPRHVRRPGGRDARPAVAADHPPPGRRPRPGRP